MGEMNGSRLQKSCRGEDSVKRQEISGRVLLGDFVGGVIGQGRKGKTLVHLRFRGRISTEGKGYCLGTRGI